MLLLFFADLIDNLILTVLRMIKFHNPIPDAETTFTRKVGYDILQQLYLLTNLPSNTDVIFNGQTDTTPIKNDNILNSTNDRPYTIKAGNRNLIKVSIDEEQEPGTSQTIPMYKAEEESIFQDRALGIVVYPAYQTSRLTFTLQIHFASRKRAQMWVSELNGKISSGSEHTIHLLNYSYYIPEETIAFLKHAHELREAVAGYGDTFEQWMTANANKRMTVMVNHAAKNATYSIGELQSNSYGKFEFGEVPKGDVSSEVGFDLNVEYTVIVKRPFNVIVSTPTVIHQQILKTQYVNLGKRLAYNPLTLFAGAGTFAKIMEEEYYKSIPATWYENGIRAPWYDTWRPYNKLPSMQNLITILCRFTSPEERFICKLPEVSSRYVLHPDVMEYVVAAGEDVLRFGRSAVKISLFANDEVLVDDALAIDAEMNVTVRNPVNLRHTYRLSVGLNPCLWSLSPEQFELFRIHGKACIIILRMLCPHLVKMGIIPKLLPNGRVSIPDLRKCIAYMEKFIKGLSHTQVHPAQLLLTQYTLIADRKLPDAAKDILNVYL